MNKDSVAIFNAFVDRQFDLAIKAASYEGPEKVKEEKLYHAEWRKRGDEWTSKQLEKEYGPIE